MKTYTLKKFNMKTTIKADKIYPLKPKDDGTLHDTVTIKLNKDQAIELANQLSVASIKWDTVDVTVFRKDNSITLTTQKK